MTSVEPPAAHPEPPELPERPTGAPETAMPRWPAWAPVAALAAGFAAATVVAILLGIVGAVFGADISDPPPAVSILSVIGQDICLIGAALLFARMAAPTPRPWHFGLAPVKRLAPAIGWVVGGYFAFLLFSYLWLAAIGQTDQEDDIVESLGGESSTIALIGITFVVTVCAPLAEELLFRGFTFGALRRHGLWVAAGATGLLFGFVHVFGSPIAFLVPLAMLGATLCVIRERTGSLYPCIVLHCANNTFAMSADQGWDWQIPVTLGASLAVIWLAVVAGLRWWPWGADHAVRAPAVG